MNTRETRYSCPSALFCRVDVYPCSGLKHQARVPALEAPPGTIDQKSKLGQVLVQASSSTYSKTFPDESLWIKCRDGALLAELQPGCVIVYDVM